VWLYVVHFILEWAFISKLQTKEITLVDKHVKKETWTCAYCRAVISSEELVCQSYQAPKKKS